MTSPVPQRQRVVLKQLGKCKATIRFGVARSCFGIDRLGNVAESLRHEVFCAGNVLIFNGEVAEKQSSVSES